MIASLYVPITYKLRIFLVLLMSVNAQQLLVLVERYASKSLGKLLDDINGILIAMVFLGVTLCILRMCKKIPDLNFQVETKICPTGIADTADGSPNPRICSSKECAVIKDQLRELELQVNILMLCMLCEKYRSKP